jgi:hypothetical protein
MLTRRQLLGLIASTGVFLNGRPATAAPAGARKPRYLVQIGLGGGSDSIYTVDPKTKSEVEPWVDVPYSAHEIIEAGGLRLGPHFAPLAPWASRMTLLNGVACATVSHETGRVRIARLRLDATDGSPTLLDVVGERSAEHPLPSVSLGFHGTTLQSRNWFPVPDILKPGSGGETQPSPNVFEFLAAVDPSDLQRLAASLRRTAAKLTTHSSPGAAGTALNYARAAALLERLPSCSRFKEETWSPEPEKQTMARHLQRTLWLLENDLTPTALLYFGMLEWDTHHSNAERQTRWNGNFAHMAARFLAELDRRSNAHGTLAANTNLIVSSELGRHPRVNSNRGKDHFPEVSFLFLGPDFSSGTGGRAFGQTNRSMAALPISLRTGRPDAPGALPNIEDVGATVLGIYGIEPASAGYDGRRLRFLSPEVRA